MKYIEKAKMGLFMSITIAVITTTLLLIIASRRAGLIDAVSICENFSTTCQSQFSGEEIENCTKKAECIDMARNGNNPY